MERIRKTLKTIGILFAIYIVNKAVGVYTIFLPAVVIFGSYLIIERSLSTNKKPLFLSYSFISGHILSTILIIIWVIIHKENNETERNILANWGNMDKSVFLDIGIYCGLLIWLTIRPGLFAGILTVLFILFEVIGLSVVVSQTNNEYLMKIHIVNITVYAMTIISLIYGIVVYRKNNIALKAEISNSPTSISP